MIALTEACWSVFEFYVTFLVYWTAKLAFVAIFLAFFIHLLVIIINRAKCQFRWKKSEIGWLPPDCLIAYHAFVYHYIIFFALGIDDTASETWNGWVERGKKRFVDCHDLSFSDVVLYTIISGIIIPVAAALIIWFVLFLFGALLFPIILGVVLLLKYTWWLWLIGGIAYISRRAVKSYRLRQKLIDEEIENLKISVSALTNALSADVISVLTDAIAASGAAQASKKKKPAGEKKPRTKKTSPQTRKDKQ
ncbi:MAG: hypothetical protein WCT16_05085 [Candidatus Buchananbacteria bacterium]